MPTDPRSALQPMELDHRRLYEMASYVPGQPWIQLAITPYTLSFLLNAGLLAEEEGR